MPTEYVKKLAEEHHMSLEEAERRWDEAKEKAKEEGTSRDYYAYVTAIFKSMMGETKEQASKGGQAKRPTSKGHGAKGRAAAK